MDEPGEFVILPDTHAMRVYEERNALNYRFVVPNRKWGPVEPRIKKDAPWFAYIENANRVWVYDGDDDLVLLRNRPGRDSGSYSIKVCGDWLRQQIPPEVASRMEKCKSGRH
jgi:hypothetical protein